MHGGIIMCDKNDMDDLFEFLGFQEALKNSYDYKPKHILKDIFNAKNNNDDNDNNTFLK